MPPGEATRQKTTKTHARFLEREIAWFGKVLDARLRRHGGEEAVADPAAPPRVPTQGSPYAALLRELDLGPAERLLLMLAFLPHIRPEALDPFLLRNRVLGRRFTEFGGFSGAAHGGFLPSAETAMFLLAGDDLAQRLACGDLFDHEHRLYTRGILRLHRREPDEPKLSATLALTENAIERLTTGRPYEPPFSPEFPAQRITTAYRWEDLVLEPATRLEVEQILAWIRHEPRLLRRWGLDQRLKPGYRALFWGPPGTGKTLTCALLGQASGLPAYRIDLSKVVSKYFGETEKNLASLFDQAQHRQWILFFDEAEALFGKRSESRSANDRAANQQIAYLLQRIEDFPGVVLLATNQRDHLDEAFARRFQAMVHFPVPKADLRLRLWRDNFEDKPYRLAEDVDLAALARDHELAGGAIINVLRFACLQAVERDPPEIRRQDLVRGVRRELRKQGKVLGGR